MPLDRRQLETTATYIAVVSLFVMVLGSTFAVADGALGWDLLPKNLEKVALFLFGTTAIITVSSVLVSVMLNISILADRVSKIADRN